MTLTIGSWFRSEPLVVKLADVRNAPRRRSGKASRDSQAVQGRGGLPFLLRLSLGRTALIGAIITVVILLLHGMLEYMDFSAHDIRDAFGLQWILVVGMLPVFAHLRCLRTLPISNARLAAILAVTPLVALLVVSLATELCLATVYHQPAPPILALSVLPAAVIAVLIPMVVKFEWRSAAYGAILGLLIGCTGTMEDFADPQFPPLAGSAILVMLACGSFIATKLVLDRSSHAYRPGAWSQFAGRSWGVRR
jgi:uncharacterized membrane protein